MIRDRNIDWLRQRRRIPWNEFNVSKGSASAGAGAAAWDVLSEFHYGGPKLELNDELATLDLETPTLWDPREEIGVRAIYCCEPEAVLTESVTFIVSYDQNDIEEALTDPKAGTGAALDTVIPAHSPTSTSALMLYRTGRGIINADKFDFNSRLGVIAWAVEFDAKADSGYGQGDLMFLGLEIDYMPLSTRNTHETGVGALTSDVT